MKKEEKNFELLDVDISLKTISCGINSLALTLKDYRKNKKVLAFFKKAQELTDTENELWEYLQKEDGGRYWFYDKR